MTNELSKPISGIGPEGAFTVECLGKPFVIRYVANIRTGANMPMVVDTIKHFKHAVQCLAAGYKKPSAAVGERDVYTDAIVHDDTRSNVWTFRSFAVVPVGDKIFKVPINLCNEFTSAAELINWVWFGVIIMDTDDLVDDFIQAGSIIAPGQAPKPKSELDKHFPRDENGKPVDASNTPAAPQQRNDYSPEAHESGKYLGGYDYKKKADYMASYGGTDVKFDVMRMERIYDTRDASPIIQVYSSYNNSVSKYPAHDLKIKKSRLEKVDDYTRAILQPLFDAPQGEKPVCNTSFIASYFMFMPEDGKMYPVLGKLEPDTKQPAAEQQQSEPAPPPTVHPGDETPF